MSTINNPLPTLELPRRWEILLQRSQQSGVDPSLCVERVDDAVSRLDLLLQRVRTGGGGLFEVVFGLSGSGKTTFLRTLPKFFQDLAVQPFDHSRSLDELPAFVSNTSGFEDKPSRVVVIERRDNPPQDDLAKIDRVMAELLNVFRTPGGGALVLWPITRKSDADLIAAKAWETGRDSLVESSMRGIYHFKGLSKERFYEIADSTSRTLGGDGLEAFGVTKDIGRDLLPNCETISDFYAAVDAKADERRQATWSIIRQRVRLHLWVLLPGDVLSELESTVASLTQGTRSKIDIDLIAEFVDQPGNRALYLEDWRRRRSALGHLIRAIDLRLFPLPPNIALAAVRAFGNEEARKPLKQATVNLEQAKAAMRSSRVYKEILSVIGIGSPPFAGSRNIGKETEDEYRRVQAAASTKDKLLNKALGSLMQACLAEDAVGVSVVPEKKSLPNSELKPDVQICVAPGHYICLEPTWRSTETGIPGELEGGQNTLTAAHLKKYVLEKAVDYIKDLGL